MCPKVGPEPLASRDSAIFGIICRLILVPMIFYVMPIGVILSIPIFYIGTGGRQLRHTPPPKNVRRGIYEYVDRLKFFSLFLVIAQFNNNKTRPHNTSTTHNNNQNEPPLPDPRRLCPLIPWACQRRPQRIAPRFPMAPRKAPVIGFGRAMVGSFVGGGK